MAVEPTFSEFLAARGLKEDDLDPHRRAQLLTFYKDAKAEPPVPEVRDAAGVRIAIGSDVAVTLRVTGIHLVPGDPDRGTKDRVYLNLARVINGAESHQFNYDASLVKVVG